MGKISEADWKYRGNYLCEQAIWQVMLSYAKKTEAQKKSEHSGGKSYKYGS